MNHFKTKTTVWIGSKISCRMLDEVNFDFFWALDKAVQVIKKFKEVEGWKYFFWKHFSHLLITAFFSKFLETHFRDWIRYRDNFLDNWIFFKAGNIKSLLFSDSKWNMVYKKTFFKNSLHFRINFIHFFHFLHLFSILFSVSIDNTWYS